MERRFRKLYCLSAEKVKESIDRKSLVFIGKNGDFYFSSKINEKALKVFNNVILSEKYNKEQFIDIEWSKVKCNYLLKI